MGMVACPGIVGCPTSLGAGLVAPIPFNSKVSRLGCDPAALAFGGFDSKRRVNEDERGCTWDGPGLVSSLPTFGPRLFGHHAPRVVNTAGWARSLFRRQFTRNGTLCPLGGLRNPLWAPHSWRLVDFGMPILALRLLPRFHLLSAWTHLRGGVCSAWASPWSPRCCGMAI